MQDSRPEKRFRCTAQRSQVDTIAATIDGYTADRLEARGRGPIAALQHLKATTQTNAQKRAWVTSARTAALLGSAPKSHKSIASGQRAWCAFARHTLGLQGRELPPPIDGLIAWAELFRHPKTYNNYLAHVRLACHLLGVSDAVFSINSAQLKRAKTSIKKKSSRHTPRPRMFIKKAMVQSIVQLPSPTPGQALPITDQAWHSLKMLFLAAYAFLLRLPSEALSMTRGGIGFGFHV